MKRIIIFSLLLIAYSGTFASTSGKNITEERTVPEFTEILIKGSVDVVYTQDKSVQIEVKGKKDEVKNVITHVENKVLTVDYKNGSSWFSSTGDLVVYASSPQLTKVKIAGSGDFKTKNTLEGDNFELSIYGSGDGNCNLDVRDFRLKVHGSGDVQFQGVKNTAQVTVNGSGDAQGNNLDLIEGTFRQHGSGDLQLSGYCRDFSLRQSGSGDCHAKDLSIKNANIQKSGSGDATLTVNNKLVVDSSGSGDTHCFGTPSSVNESTDGSGELHIK
ncbi:MAG: DUF2807 domain-containing protein [Bacteroidales bacterium]|nr:DUF2807 domain-containing protein [Bacteroidales bacterium]